MEVARAAIAQRLADAEATSRTGSSGAGNFLMLTIQHYSKSEPWSLSPCNMCNGDYCLLRCTNEVRLRNGVSAQVPCSCPTCKAYHFLLA